MPTCPPPSLLLVVLIFCTLPRAVTGSRDAQAMMRFVVCPDRNTARSTAYGSGCLQTCPSFAIRGGANLDVCIECPIHTVRSTDGKCVGCPPGEDRSLGEDACDKCMPGSATAGNSVGCTSCEKGYFAASNGSVFCTICAGGSYQDMVGSASCAPCPAGSFCFQGATEPNDCPINSYCPAESVDPEPCGTNLVTGGLGAVSKVCSISHPRINHLAYISVCLLVPVCISAAPLLDPQRAPIVTPLLLLNPPDALHRMTACVERTSFRGPTALTSLASRATTRRSIARSLAPSGTRWR